MNKNNFFTSLPFKLLMGVFLGICIGLVLNYADGNAATRAILNVVVTAKYILGQLINFCVPLIIIGKRFQFICCRTDRKMWNQCISGNCRK